MNTKKVTILIASRNDDYGINPQIRLKNTLTSFIDCVDKYKLSSILNVLVVDFDSDSPLQDLCPQHENIEYFPVSKSSLNSFFCEKHFPETALCNIAIKHSNSNYFLKIDQDMIIGPNFYNFLKRSALPQLAFSGCRNMGYDENFINNKLFLSKSRFSKPLFQPDRCYNILKKKKILPFYSPYRGALFFNREVFNKVRGFNEGLIYQNYINVEFINRSLKYYPIYNLGLKINFDFFHQKHDIKQNRLRLDNSHKYLKFSV